MFPHRFLFVAFGFCAALAQAAGKAPEGFPAQLSLVRYEMPLGQSDGFAPTRQTAQRRAGEDAIDWPDVTLDGRPIFRQGPEEQVALPVQVGAAASSPFQLRTDAVLQPGNHWLRAMDWRSGRRHLYTADRAARTANSSDAKTGRYELWLFPLRISGDGGPGVKNVILRVGTAVLYQRDGPWRSLTLLLPASEPGRPYELSVDGRPALKIEMGLQPVKLGSPRERILPLDTVVPGDGPKVRVQVIERAETFPHPQEWAADVAALQQPLPAAPKLERPAGMARYLGVEVPRSPLLLYAAQLPSGQSSGFYRQGSTGFQGTPEEWALHVAELGFDAVFEASGPLPEPAAAESFEQSAAALARYGVKLGLQYDNQGGRPNLQHPTLPLFAHTLPEWHAPLYRSLSLAAQRFGRLPNFLGLSVGAASSGYAADWQPSPPVPDRPWGEAMIEFLGKPQPTVPRAPQAGPPELPFEYVAKDTGEFIKYVQRYEAAFQQYEYFHEAVRQASSRLVFTTSCFGSAPGPGARGGWPWASLSGRAIFGGLAVQQAHDWNATRAAKPLHLEALLDRLESYGPKKTTWALMDNFGGLYGREAYQRACALALSRGVQGLGTNFLAHPAGEGARPEVVAFQKELHAWLHQMGGVYAHLEPQATIGVFYGHHQAVQRPVLTGESLSGEQIYTGSQEGKVTEALFLCHAAGWPARVITYQELMRGPLPTGMKAILVVGADQPDASWQWDPGLDKPLRQFVEGGGRILLDADSACSVPCTKTALRVAAYQPQSQLDPTPLLLQRNAGNIDLLRAAMAGVAAPLAASTEPTIWALPATCGDVQYVTIVNQASAQGDEARETLRPADPRATKLEVWKTKANASLYVRPQAGTLAWSTTRPIYDARRSRPLAVEEAGQVDFSRDAFQLYALPPRPVQPPTITVARGTSGFFEAAVEVGGGQPLAGVPLWVRVSRGSEVADLFGATGFPVRLPLREGDAVGEYRIMAMELLSGLSAEMTFPLVATEAAAGLQSGVRVREPAAVAKFAARKSVPLTIGVTPEQAREPKLMEQVRLLEEFYRFQKRTVTVARLEPGSVVESLQPLRSPHAFPHWKTIPSDLVLLGTPADNVLLLDQARGEIFPWGFQAPPAGKAEILYTRSPFVGEFDAVNVVARDLPSLAAAVKTITAPTKAPGR